MTNYLKNEIMAKNPKNQRGLFAAFICAIILVGIFYMYCISAIVMETVNRNKNFQNLQAIEREYQNLEQNYLALIPKFNLDYAYSLGFVGSGSLAYISRQTSVAQNSNYDKTLR